MSARIMDIPLFMARLVVDNWTTTLTVRTADEPRRYNVVQDFPAHRIEKD